MNRLVMSTLPGAERPSRLHGSSLLVALSVMLVGTLYPPGFADAQGRVDHPFLLALLWAMSAGFVHGLGFVPRRMPWRALWSGQAVWAALALAGWLHFG